MFPGGHKACISYDRLRTPHQYKTHMHLHQRKEDESLAVIIITIFHQHQASMSNSYCSGILLCPIYISEYTVLTSQQATDT